MTDSKKSTLPAHVSRCSGSINCRCGVRDFITLAVGDIAAKAMSSPFSSTQFGPTHTTHAKINAILKTELTPSILLCAAVCCYRISIDFKFGQWKFHFEHLLTQFPLNVFGRPSNINNVMMPIEIIIFMRVQLDVIMKFIGSTHRHRQSSIRNNNNTISP